ncbi:hypothetical protein D3C78_495470 [compost metagenome]
MTVTLGINPKKIAQFLILISPFISGLNTDISGTTVYLHYITMLTGTTLIIATNKKLYMPSEVFIFYLATLIISTASAILSNNNQAEKTIITHTFISGTKLAFTMLFVISFLCLYHSHKKSIESLFTPYLNISIAFCYIAIAQEIIFITTKINIPEALGLTYKNYGSYIGVPSLSVEPAFFACAILPAACYYIAKAIKSRELSMNIAITTIAIFISTSSLGVLGIIACTTISLLFTRKGATKAIFLCSILIIPIYALTTSDFFQLRLQDTIRLISSGELSESNGINLSTYAIGVNAAITTQSITDNHGLGVGFGQYSAVFEQYISNYAIPGYRDSIPGEGSATSFLLRITAELGLIGLAAAIFLLIRCTHPTGSKNINHINIACASTFIIILFRMGEYYSNGVILVICMLIASHAEIKSNRNISKYASQQTHPKQEKQSA